MLCLLRGTTLTGRVGLTCKVRVFKHGRTNRLWQAYQGARFLPVEDFVKEIERYRFG